VRRQDGGEGQPPAAGRDEEERGGQNRVRRPENGRRRRRKTEIEPDEASQVICGGHERWNSKRVQSALPPGTSRHIEINLKSNSPNATIAGMIAFDSKREGVEHMGIQRIKLTDIQREK
jgi:hypothetical protein